MPSLEAGGTRINVEETETVVILHLEDVAVPADEKLGWALDELSYNATVITSRITADVSHQHIGTLARPP